MVKNSITWHFECNDGTHYVEWIEDTVKSLRRVTEEVYQAILNRLNNINEEEEFLQ